MYYNLINNFEMSTDQPTAVENCGLVLSTRSKYFKDSLRRAYEYKVNRPLLSYQSSNIAMALSKTWSTTDDCKLIEIVKAVENENNIDWENISGCIAGMTARDCISRYYNVLKADINKSSWSTEEENMLLNLLTKHGLHDWFEVSTELGTNRTPFECLRHYQQTLNNKIVNSEEWTPEEDIKLKNAIDQFGSNWQWIARRVGNRSALQCMNRWRKSPYCNTDIVSGHWLESEERKLFLAAIAYDVPSLTNTKRPLSTLDEAEEVMEEPRQTTDWTAIAKLVHGKNEIQCREKWCNNLDPGIRSTPFTAEEDELLELLVNRVGKGSWSKIASYIPYRSDAMVRKRWKELHPDEEVVVAKKKVLPSKHRRTQTSHIKAEHFESKLGFEIPSNLKS